jgi:trimethylamine--corrinoid protein Co-methyltransferase
MPVYRNGPDVPQFRLLTDEKIAAIHAGAIDVLENVGIRVAHDEACELLRENGGIVEGDQLVKIPGELVDRALDSAPSAFSLYDRNGQEALKLGAGYTYYGAGVTNLAFTDIDNDHHDFTVEDIGRVAFLADALENIDFVSTPGVIKPGKGKRLQLLDQQGFMQMVTNTTMPLVVLSPDPYQMEDVFEMSEIVAGGPEAFRAKPFIMPYLNTVSPLVFNPETVAKLFIAVDRGTPVCLQAAPPVGGSVPVTVAGGLVISAAETLLGLVLAQLRSPGTPYVSGVVPFVMDMRSGNTAAASPDVFKMVVAMGEITRHWGLPSVGTGCSSDSKIPDEQSAFETPYYTQAGMFGGMDLVFNMGRLECGLLHAPVVLIYADEAIRMHRAFMDGLHVDDETLALQVIHDVGPGGFFLGHQHTRDHFRELWEPTIESWEPRDQWEGRGATTMLERAKSKVERLRRQHTVEPLPAGVLAEMQAVIDRREATLEDEDD